MSTWDHTSNEEFFDYYAQESLSVETLSRFRSIRDRVLDIAAQNGVRDRKLEIADVGCGAGTQSMVWCEVGHSVHGLDVNQPLIELARRRSSEEGHAVDFHIGSATKLPWADESMDVCLFIELLEHVVEWRQCLDEGARVLRPNGVLVLTTSNKLCPVQAEFNLPLYSWYPGPLKRYFEHLAVTTRPDLANFAKYPAVNWFSFYSLRAEMSRRGLRSLDRFDVMDMSNKGLLARGLVGSIRSLPPLRLLGHVATPYTRVFAIKS